MCLITITYSATAREQWPAMRRSNSLLLLTWALWHVQYSLTFRWHQHYCDHYQLVQLMFSFSGISSFGHRLDSPQTRNAQHLCVLRNTHTHTHDRQFCSSDNLHLGQRIELLQLWQLHSIASVHRSMDHSPWWMQHHNSYVCRKWHAARSILSLPVGLSLLVPLWYSHRHFAHELSATSHLIVSNCRLLWLEPIHWPN